MSDRWTQNQIFEDKGENKIFGVGYAFKKSKVKIKGRKSRSFAVMFSILFVALVLLVANLTNNVIFTSAVESSPLEITESNYYAISVSSFASKELAMEASHEIKNLGGAGYLFLKDNKFFCLTSVYDKENSAISVCNKLANMNYTPEIVELKSPKVSYAKHLASLAEDERQNISNLLLIFDKGFEKINYLSTGFDKHEISYIECKKEILDFQNKYLPMYKNYLNSVENLNEKEISALTQALHKVFEKMEEFSNASSENSNFSALLKNLLINISIAKCQLS